MKGEAGDDEIFLLDICEFDQGKLLIGGAGDDTLWIPPGTTEADLDEAGVVRVGIETVLPLPSSRSHESDCS